MSIHIKHTKKESSGFTLIELLITLSIVGLLMGVLVLLLQTSLDAWALALGEVSLQKALGMVMSTVTVGDFETKGIEEALEITVAASSSISYIPLQEDVFQVTNPAGEDEWTLQHHFKPGTSYPVVEKRIAPGGAWTLVPRGDFQYGADIPPAAPDDKVKVATPIPFGNEVRILYHAMNDAGVVKNINWDGITLKNNNTPVEMKTMRDVNITGFQLSYFDKAGNPIANPGANLDDIFSVRVDLRGRSGDVQRTLSSSTRLLVKERLNIQTIPVGHFFSIPIPDSADITALGVKNITVPAAPPGPNPIQIQIRITSGNGVKWFIYIDITNSKISIDYPEQGPIAYDYEENVNISLEQGVQFLDFKDPTYNYNNLGFTNATLEKLITSGIAGAAIYIRP